MGNTENKVQTRTSRRLATLVGIVILTSCAFAAVQDKPTGQHSAVRPDSSWLKEHLLGEQAQLPVSFVYDRQGSEALLKTWTKKIDTKELDSVRTEHLVSWTDPKSGFQFRVEALQFANSDVVEWTAYFKNEGKTDAPVLEYVQALDISFAVKGEAIPTVLYSKGCGVMDTYALVKKPLNQLESFQISNESGGKTVETIPFFDIKTEKHGLIGALGWPGKWTINFSRATQGTIAVSAGMDGTHLSLHPGEEIRTPEILLLPWEGDDTDAHNVLRRHVLKYHTPQYDGKPVVLPVSHLGWGGMKTSTSLRLIEQITNENIGFENFWMDAGWYGADRPVDEFQIFGKEDWFLHAGSWRVNEVPHPDGKGLRPISDAAHAKGMKFLLWFEPERAVVGTPLTIQHPDWFIGEVTTHFEGNTERPLVKFRTFDFGNPVARQFMIDSISDLIDKEGIDVYRQDCNFALTPFWTQNDTSDRQGITQIRYAEGLLEFWDGLRRRHPQLILDIVQRGDLETISRAVDLSRADYPVSPDADPIGAQISTEGLAYWRPHFGTLLQVRPRDTYHFRSGMAPGLAFALFNVAGYPNQVGNFIPADFPFDWMRNMVAQLKLVRPYYYGDYYPLLPCSENSDCATDPSQERSAAFEWAAWQFNRPDAADGMVQAFRREESTQASENLRLRGLDPAAKYEVTDLDAKTPSTVSGKDLMQQGLHVEIKEKRGAAILLYKKVR
ncbi:MAG TPA: alpha-galactosidase [Terriglobales bacterium]|nr:alpha-galactosidase [Terriglobales bacterium]